MFGELTVTRGEQIVRKFRTRKTGALLAYLAYHGGRQHPREVLVEMFWPAVEPEAGRQSLSMAITAIRQAVEPENVTDDAGLLLIDRHMAGINAAGVTTDVAEFEAALNAAEHTQIEAERKQKLAAAVSLYSGDLLPAYYDEWIFPEQQRLAGRYGQALRDLAELNERMGATADALKYALRAVGTDPLDEAAARQAMRLLAMCGRIDAAMQLCRDLERRLKEQWNVALEAETRTLFGEIQAGSIKRTAPPEHFVVETQDRIDSATRAEHVTVTMPLDPLILEPAGGAMPVSSRFYIERAADAQLKQALLRGDGIVLLKGARQVGKTTLIARGMQRARETACRVAHAQIQLFKDAQFASVDSFLLALAQCLTVQLNPDSGTEITWDPARGSNQNLRRWLRRDVLGNQEARIVWGLDEVDRLLDRPYCAEVFGLFRSFHDERALDPDAPWSRLTMVISYSTEAHLLIKDPNQSPFNVGTKLALDDFIPSQVADLNSRYGTPLRTTGELDRFNVLLGGQPYLTQRGLYALATEGMTLDMLELRATAEDGAFTDHLSRILSLLRLDQELRCAMEAIISGAPGLSHTVFYRLRAAGWSPAHNTRRGARAPDARFTRIFFASNGSQDKKILGDRTYNDSYIPFSRKVSGLCKSCEAVVIPECYTVRVNPMFGKITTRSQTPCPTQRTITCPIPRVSTPWEAAFTPAACPTSSVTQTVNSMTH